MKKIYFIFCLGVLMMSAQMKGFGQILAWDFYANASGSATYNSTYNDPNVDASVLTRGAGAGAGGGYSYGFSMRFVEAANSYETAKTADAYLEFKVKSSTAYISLEGIDVKLRSHSDGATNYRWAYKKPDDSDFIPLGAAAGTFPVYDSENDQGVTQPTLDLATVAALQNIPANTEVTFRLYGWGGTGTANTNTSAIGKSASAAGSISLMLRGVTTTSPITLSSHPQIAAWEFSLLSGTTNGSVNATSSDPNLDAIPVLSRGGGLIAGNYARAYTSQLGSVVDVETADKYYQIELNTKEDYYTTLSTLLFRYRSLAAGPKSYQWKYSLNDGTPVNIGSTGTFPSTNGDGWDILLDLSSINNLRNIAPETSVKLMLYVWGNTDGSAVNGFGRFNHATTAFNSIYIRGAVTDQPLPVKLTSFNAIKGLNGINLNWQTASEENNSHFEIYRSGSGKPDELLGTVKGNGTSSSINVYSFTDYSPLAGTNYYQLRQVDVDGKYNESAIVSVNTILQETSIKVYSNSDLKIWIARTETGKGTLQITDVLGRSVHEQSVSLQVGENLFSLPFSSNKGVYVVSLVSDNGERLSTKFIR